MTVPYNSVRPASNSLPLAFRNKKNSRPFHFRRHQHCNADERRLLGNGVPASAVLPHRFRIASAKNLEKNPFCLWMVFGSFGANEKLPAVHCDHCHPSNLLCSSGWEWCCTPVCTQRLLTSIFGNAAISRCQLLLLGQLNQI